MNLFQRFVAATGTFVALFAFAPAVSAQGMMGYYAQPTPTQTGTQQLSPEEAAGKAIAIRLQQQQISCSDLTAEDYEKLGEYYMGQNLGANHDAADASIQRMMGDAGDQQMHIMIGERQSGCFTASAGVPSGGTGSGYGYGDGSGAYAQGYYPMGMMGWPASAYGASAWDQYGYGWDFMVGLILTLGLIGMILLIRGGMGRRSRLFGASESALEILKQRYAKGEIDQKEFEERKKDILS